MTSILRDSLTVTEPLYEGARQTKYLPISLKTQGVLPYWFTIFWGAFLLFSVQLLLGKYFLPWFGGTPAMWTTCMFFFQTLLLAGYAYAHALAKWFTPRTQGYLHTSLLFSSLVLLASLALAWGTPIPRL